MRRLAVVALVAASIAAGPAVGEAAERTVTLRLHNMSCAGCAYIVKRTLGRLSGVTAAAVSYEKKTAVVRYDDSLVTPAALTAATAKAGFPSRVVSGAQR